MKVINLLAQLFKTGNLKPTEEVKSDILGTVLCVEVLDELKFGVTLGTLVEDDINDVDDDRVVTCLQMNTIPCHLLEEPEVIFKSGSLSACWNFISEYCNAHEEVCAIEGRNKEAWLKEMRRRGLISDKSRAQSTAVRV